MEKWKQAYINGVKKNEMRRDLYENTLEKIKLHTAEQARKGYQRIGKKIIMAACIILGILVIVPAVSYAAYGVNIMELLAKRNKEVSDGGGLSLGIPDNTAIFSG